MFINEKKTHENIHEHVDRIVNSENKPFEFSLLSYKIQGEVFLNLPKQVQKEIGEKLREKKIIKIIKYLTTDQIANFLQSLPDKKHKKISKKLDENIKEKVDYLLNFHPESAPRLMNFQYISIHKNSDIKTLYEKVKKIYKKGKPIPMIIVRNKNNQLLGEIPFENLILNKPKNIEEIIKEVPVVYYDEDFDDIVKKIKPKENKGIVVTDYENKILGVINIGDLLKIIEKKQTKEIYNLAGVKFEENIFDSALTKFKSRYKWLILNLFTGFLAATVVSIYEETLNKLILLAIYMPIIAGMGGNAATQTLAVVVRGISTHRISFRNRIRILFNEIFAGILNGILTGIIVAIIAILWNKEPLLGLIVGISMIANLAISGFFGSILPFILDRFNIDPAVAATVFVTTATDVFGFFIFLGLAEIFLI